MDALGVQLEGHVEIPSRLLFEVTPGVMVSHFHIWCERHSVAVAKYIVPCWEAYFSDVLIVKELV
jgi:hypothetical protein